MTELLSSAGHTTKWNVIFQNATAALTEIVKFRITCVHTVVVQLHCRVRQQLTHLYVWQQQDKQLFVVKVGLVKDVVGADGRVRVTVEQHQGAVLVVDHVKTIPLIL